MTQLDRFVVRATREPADLRLGASPGASVALYRATQAWAYLQGRGFTLADDVVAIAPAVLGRGTLLDVDRELRGDVLAFLFSPRRPARRSPAGVVLRSASVELSRLDSDGAWLSLT